MTSATGKLLFHMMGALAEFERALTVEQVNAALAAARSRGKVGGRPWALPDADMKLRMKFWDDKSISVSAIARRFNASRSSVYRNVRRYQEAQVERA